MKCKLIMFIDLCAYMTNDDDYKYTNTYTSQSLIPGSPKTKVGRGNVQWSPVLVLYALGVNISSLKIYHKKNFNILLKFKISPLLRIFKI